MTETFVHVDEAVAMAMTLLPEQSTLDKAIARHWSYMGLRNIGPTHHWYEECIIYPNENLTLKKPDDLWKAIDIALYTYTGQELRYSFKGMGSGRIHTPQTLALQQDQYSPVLGAPIDLSEDTHAYHLGSNGAGVSYATLRYWQLPITVDGLPQIPEGLVLAVALFIRWMWSIKQNMDKGDRQLNEITYKSERAKCLSETKMPSGIELEQVGKEWTSLLNSPKFKQF